MTKYFEILQGPNLGLRLGTAKARYRPNRPEFWAAWSRILAQNIPVHAMGWYKISQLNIWDST